MRLNRLKITIRNARKNGVLSFAKIFGLSLSFAVILFSAGYVYYETSFDKSVTDYNKIYRCLMQGQLNDEVADFAVTSPAQAEAMVTDIPEITEATRIIPRGNATLSYNDINLVKGELFFTDSGFFQFFGIPLKTNTEAPLASNNSLIIAKSIAAKHFGSAENAIGKAAKIGEEECIITGVFDDLPTNFHLRIKFVQSLEKTQPEKVGWGSQNYITYVKTNQAGLDADKLSFKISKTVYTHYDDRMDGAKAQNWEDLKYADNLYLFYTAEPLSAVHFSNHKFDPSVTANKTYVYGAIILAILVLLISSINFINLTIANISTRFKEVGIRKTIGAYKKNVIIQFMYETFAFVLVSFLLATVIYSAAGKPLASFLGFEIFLTKSLIIKIIIGVFIILLLFNLTVNIIPISIASNKKMLSLIKGEPPVKKHQWGNNSFILAQFIISGLIILSSVIVQKQINFMVNKDRGYDSENVMMLTMWQMNPQTRKSFIEKLKTYPAVQSVSTSDVYFGQDFGMNGAWFETREDKNYFHTSVLPADDQFVNTFNLTMKEGRFFEKERKTDSDAVVLNEAAVNEYSGEGSLVGKNLIVGDKTYRVVGIVKDFNFRSLYHLVEPLVISQIENFGNVCIKVRNAQVAEVAAILKNLWKEYHITFPLDYSFHDEVVAMHYAKDQQAKKLLLLLSIISIVIACVGLYAVSFFTIIRKTKEIGVRKVNGAKVSEVMAMLNINFIKRVVIAFMIATPLAWYAMNKWLENFAYKTAISWWIFALSGLVAVGISLLTVSWQSWKAATRNPVEALRYE